MKDEGILGSFLIGFAVGIGMLLLVYINGDTTKEYAESQLKTGELLCEKHGGLKSFDIKKYTCMNGVVVTISKEYSSKNHE